MARRMDLDQPMGLFPAPRGAPQGIATVRIPAVPKAGDGHSASPAHEFRDGHQAVGKNQKRAPFYWPRRNW